MTSELKILKGIWDNNEEAPIGLLARQAGFGIDYTRYICNCLVAKEQVKLVKGKRDWYRVTAQGRKELERIGIIKPGVRKERSDTERVIYYLPRSVPPQKSKSRMSEKPQNVGPKKIRGTLSTEEKKLNLGKAIEKAISYLRNL